jgi:hypothetical protein
MVKVIPFTLFEGDIVSLQHVGYEPLHLTVADDVFLVATKTGYKMFYENFPMIRY